MGSCAACGASNRDGVRYCASCGAPQQATCPQCGAGVEAGDAFCTACGADVGSVAPANPSAGPAPAAAAGRERRRVSVLFCDLVGYTTLADGRDPEELRELLSGYFDVARAVITRYGGVVEKFIGDAVMAVWGAPVTHEDDAERAVRAGLELVDAVPAFGASHGEHLGARVGVASGAVATVEAVEEGLVVGDRVNLAARVQSAAPAGACYVDDATRRLAGEAIAFQDAGEQTLKGIPQPVRLHHALRVVGWVGGRARTGGLEAPLVGRDVELRALKDLFHASAERSVPRLVVVTGPAGVGKSRLGWELEKYIDGLVETVLWHRGRCLSYGEGVAFWALAEMVRQRLSIAEDDPTDAAAAKLTEGLVRLVPEAERDYVGARLARLLGVESPDRRAASLSREELFAGWRLLFERLAAVAPVVMVVEDAQHADGGLLEFLDHLVDWTRQLPVFVVVLARPELAERWSRFGAGRNRSVLSLDPLDQASMAGLVAALVPGIGNREREAITERAQGIPLFAVETVRSLVDSGVVVADEHGAHRLVGDLETIQVPDSLQALLAARLDVLDAATRHLVGVASVLGSSFPAGALASVSGTPIDETRRALDELVRRDVLEVTADPLSPQQGDYRFAQELLRQVAYEALPRRDRRALHLAVAGHLRATFPNDGEEVAEVVARHYLDALELAPREADTGGVAGEAVAVLRRAGARAEAGGAPGRAATSYATAARLVEEWAGGGDGDGDGDGDADALRLGAELHELAAQAAYVAGAFGVGLDQAEAARAAWAGLGEPRRAARTRSLSAGVLGRAGRHSEARRHLADALAVLREPPDADTVDALTRLGMVGVFDGNLSEAAAATSEAIELGQAIGVGDTLLASAFSARAVLHSHAGRIPEAIAYLRESVRLAERAGDANRTAISLVNLSDVLLGLDPAAAAEAAAAAADHARRLGALPLLGIATSNLGVALLDLGDWQRAAEVLRAEDLVDHPVAGLLDGFFAALVGDVDRAEALLGRFADEAATEDVPTLAEISRVRAFAAWAAGDAPGALAHAWHCLGYVSTVSLRYEAIRWTWPLAARLASQVGDDESVTQLLALVDGHPAGHLPPILRAERELAAARRGAGASPAALDALRAAVEGLRRVGSPYPLAAGLLDLAEILTRAGDGTAAVAAGGEARDIAGRLGCRPLLERADRLEQVAAS